MSKTEIFISKAINKHGTKYDYSLVDYVKNYIKVKIICKEHGIFEQRPDNHLTGQGCPVCGLISRGLKSRSTINDFIIKANNKHNSKYKYDSTIYVNNRTKVSIICPSHGEFLQSPDNHLAGKGCPECANTTNLEHRFEHYKNTPTQFYIIKYKGLYKIGITTKTVDKRYAQEVADVNDIETLFIKYFNNYRDAYYHEQYILNLNSSYRYSGKPIFNNTGITELFHILDPKSFI